MAPSPPAPPSRSRRSTEASCCVASYLLLLYICMPAFVGAGSSRNVCRLSSMRR